MLKPLALSVAVCFCFTSCQVFEKSELWENVTQVRPGDSIRDPDPSSSYADKLHRVLLEQGVEHIVVVYQYHYFTHQRDEAVGTRTAIVYRDNVDERYPWWLKDDLTSTPVWLPNGELAKQISFYIRREAEVIEKKEYPARGGSGKTGLALFRPASVNQRAVFAEKPQRAVTRITQPKSAPSPVASLLVPFHAANPKPAPNAPPTHHVAVTKIERPATVAESKPKPADYVPPPVAAHSFTPWTPPPSIDAATRAFEPVPQDEHLGKLFRIQNGTAFDPTSSVDRRKMEQLKHGMVGKETSEEDGVRHGSDGLETRYR